MQWQLQEAKNKLGQLVQYAQKEPQIITLQGKEIVAVISIKDYQKIYKKKSTLLSIMQNSPWAEIDLHLSRSKYIGRNIKL
ncbi:MAG: type II toxin-antitoxin system Phd/YefM family antitoxin [Candidatus Marithrix sp.]|nr:type II toxin-antitoxin system Phd/YefM family antitoxin [Candidatus Marithrix sp.]